MTVGWNYDAHIQFSFLIDNTEEVGLISGKDDVNSK